MEIYRVNIKNFRSMQDSDDIYINGNIFAFIGQNNTGKSTILDAIQCVFSAGSKKVCPQDFYDKGKDVIIELEFSEVTKEYVAHKLFHENIVKIENHIREMVQNNERPDTIAEEKKNDYDDLSTKIDRILIKYDIKSDKMIIRLIVPYNERKRFEVLSGESITDTDVRKILPGLKVIPAIRNPQNESSAGNKSYLKELIHMLDDNMKTDITVKDNKINYCELNSIIESESNKRCEKISKLISEKYRESIGNDNYKIIINSEVDITRGTTYTTKLFDSINNLESDMMSCGTGYQSMLILAILETYVEMTNKSTDYILIIEEPEVYLHPSLQRKMIRTLVNLSKSNQVLFSTHSPIMISSLGKENIALVIKEHGRGKVVEIELNKVIEELGVRPDDIFLKKAIIMVEGPDDKSIIKELISKINTEVCKDIDIIETGSCTNMKFYANAQMLFNTTYKPNVLIIRDADGKSPEAQKECLCSDIKKLANDKFIDIEDKVFVIGKHAIESLFIDPDIISDITGLDYEYCSKVVSLYNEVYDYNKKSNIKEEEFCKYFQPKYFFEKNLDKYGYDDNQARDRWDEAYYKKINKAIKEIGKSDDEISEFKTVREELNNYTKICKKEKRNYMLEIIKKMDIDTIKHNNFKSLYDRLSRFIDKIKYEYI